MDPTRDFYSFVKLTDLPASLSLTVRIGSLQGNLGRSSLTELLEQPERRQWGINSEDFPPFYLTLSLHSNNKPLTPVFRTPYKPFKKAWLWNQVVDLAFPIRDLPLDSQLAITVWDAGDDDLDSEHTQPGALPTSRVVGGTTLRLFSRKGTLKKAQQRCRIHLSVAADGSATSQTDSKSKVSTTEDLTEMTRLEKLIKKHERMDIPHLKWLDKHTYRVIENIHSKESLDLRDQLWLYVDLPRYEWPVVWCEDEFLASSSHRAFGDIGFPSTSTSAQGPTMGASGASAPGTLVKSRAAGAKPLFDRTLFTLPDPDAARENPVEAKHRRLVRAQRSRQRGAAGAAASGGLLTQANLTWARNLKPDKKARDEIEEILASPPTTELTDKESDLLWTYRFYLTRTPRGLTKVLKAVSWSDEIESRIAVEQLLPLWSGGGESVAAGPSHAKSSFEIGDVLELLGPSCRMMHKAVRKWAVDRLAERDDEELGLYLLQLVQALKVDERDTSLEAANVASAISRSTNDFRTGQGASGEAEPSSGPLADFLVKRSLASIDSRAQHDRVDSVVAPGAAIVYNFWWYLSVECSDERWKLFYRRIRTRLERSLQQRGAGGQKVLGDLRKQAKMVDKLSETARALKSSKDARPKKIDKLRDVLKDQTALGLGVSSTGKGDTNDETRHESSHADHVDLPGLPLPLDPSVKALRVLPEKCSVFKSNLYPLLVCFEAAQNAQESSEYALIFKSGDDLRQDQLVLQLFQLMDRLLLNENLDLKMTPYRVLATSPKEGMVQFVPSKTLANIMAEYSSLAEYLKSEQDGGERAEVKTETMDRFVRSCAGYCVVTYILGVGDRHLDNLLLTPDGRFFHVDFGYILNRDPKPFPPPVKVAKEMVDCMGGTTSLHYKRFRQLCFTAFSILRKNSGLILNLVGMMVDANVGDIKIEPDRAVAKVLEKFRLDLSESEAMGYFDDLLQQSSYLTVVFDRLHDAAQFFRS
ncbi:unnamed protein product [Parajaminaea phylloscopi]